MRVLLGLEQAGHQHRIEDTHLLGAVLESREVEQLTVGVVVILVHQPSSRAMRRRLSR